MIKPSSSRSVFLCIVCGCILSSVTCLGAFSSYDYKRKKFRSENSAITVFNRANTQILRSLFYKPFQNRKHSKQSSSISIHDQKLTLSIYLGNQAQKAFEEVIHMLKSFLPFQGLCRSETSAKVGTGYQTTTKPSALRQSARGEDTSAQFKKKKVKKVRVISRRLNRWS